MNIKIPNLDISSAMNFCYELKDIVLEEGERCNVDFSGIKNCDPFPMLIVSNELSRFRKYYQRNQFIAQHCTHDYARYMKFYKACGIGVGETIDIDRHKGGYNTITRLSVKTLKEEGIESNSIIQEVIDNRAKTMAKIVAQGNDKFQKWLAFALREIIRNIPEHSESDDIWYCAQYWPFYDLVELAILDEGIGIKESLIRD